ncbi:MAG: hypothetical protein IPK99_09475 [Flavobacteriales bacterium]|nr:hypothetical protein [Flavobacteriales bacterium]
MRTSAHFLSVLLHPVFMPLLTLVTAFWLDPHLSFFLPLPLELITYGMVLVLTVLFPITSALLLLKSGAISDLAMPERQERVIPLLMTLFYSGMCLYLLHRTMHHPATYAFFTGVLLALVLTLSITLVWKISAHMVGIGGAVGTFTGLVALHDPFPFIVLAAAIIIAGALGTARLLVSDHTPGQVHAGAALGFLCTYGCVVSDWSL